MVLRKRIKMQQDCRAIETKTLSEVDPNFIIPKRLSLSTSLNKATLQSTLTSPHLCFLHYYTVV